MRIDPVSLRLFVAVMDTGTIAAAAEREHIAPSAVSRRLSDLEHVLGTPLLQRSNRGIEPTAAGRELLGLARNVLNDLDNIQVQLGDFASGERGLVRVQANLSAITGFMPAFLRGFMASHPHVQVQLQESISSAVVQGIASNAADVGIYVYGTAPCEDVVSLAFRRDELVVAVPQDHPLASRSKVGARDILPHDFVGLHTGSAINQALLRAAAEHHLPVRCRMQVTSFDALCLMVESGLGIALLPRPLGERFSRLFAIRTVALDEPWAARELRICVRSVASLSKPARLFVEHLLSQAGEAATPSPPVMAASPNGALPVLRRPESSPHGKPDALGLRVHLPFGLGLGGSPRQMETTP